MGHALLLVYRGALAKKRRRSVARSRESVVDARLMPERLWLIVALSGSELTAGRI
jgi:hypothetical protein